MATPITPDRVVSRRYRRTIRTARRDDRRDKTVTQLRLLGIVAFDVVTISARANNTKSTSVGPLSAEAPAAAARPPRVKT